MIAPFWIALGLLSSLLNVFSNTLVPPPPQWPGRQTYDRIYFTPSGVGYVASSFALLRTRDAGMTWAPLIETFRGNLPDIEEVLFVNDSTFFVYGAGGFLRTVDGGGTFQRLTARVPAIDEPQTTDYIREGFFFLDPQAGWALGDGQFLFTSDGGMHWHRRRIRRHVREPRQPMRLWMFDAQRGLGIGGRHVIRTQDGGKTWALVANSPGIDTLSCVPAGFCVGRAFPASVAYLTSDFGHSWRQTATGLLDDVHHDTVLDLQAIAPGDAVIVGGHVERPLPVFRDVDIRTPLPTVRPDLAPTPEQAFLLRWNGSTWQRTDYPNIGRFWAIHYVTPTEVWASADTNGILHSTDGGRTWTFVPDYYRQAAARMPRPTPFYPPPPPTF